MDLCELENAPPTQKCPKTFVHDCREVKSSTTSSVVAMEMLGILLTSWPRSVGLFETDGETKLATSVCKELQAPSEEGRLW